MGIWFSLTLKEKQKSAVNLSAHWEPGAECIYWRPGAKQSPGTALGKALGAHIGTLGDTAGLSENVFHFVSSSQRALMKL